LLPILREGHYVPGNEGASLTVDAFGMREHRSTISMNIAP